MWVELISTQRTLWFISQIIKLGMFNYFLWTEKQIKLINPLGFPVLIYAVDESINQNRE